MKTSKKISVGKDTIYIDVEDEITAVIDKLERSESKVVALVLPKRAATMQSVVNLKLLKRAAHTANKSIVLITSDSSVLPLAGVVGLHVAKTLQSKPAVPVVAEANDEAITVDSEVDGAEADAEPKLNPNAPIGALAGDDETIEVDTDAKDGEEKLAVGAGVKGKNRKLSVPNFDGFRTKLIIGVVLLVLLIGGWIFGSIVLPKAMITISTDTSQVNTSLALEGKADLPTANLDQNIVPVNKKELKQSSVEKVPTTGKRDDGTKATGTMTLTNCIKDNEGFTIPAGTVFTGAGLNFITTTAIELSGATYTGSTCRSASLGESETVNVIAEAGGSKYNLSARSYSSPAQYVTSQGALLASGSDMAGGTTKLVSIVVQADIDGAKQQALDKLSEAASPELRKQFSADQSVGLDGTLENVEPTIVVAPELNKEASEVSVTVNVTYVMYGVKREVLTQAIEKEVKKKIDTSKQTVQNTGLDQADIRVTDKPSPGVFKISLQTTATAGPQLDEEGIKKEVAGKKRGQTHDSIAARPGVTDVKVSYSPFWVVQTPKKTSKITVVFVQANEEKK